VTGIRRIARALLVLGAAFAFSTAAEAAPKAADLTPQQAEAVREAERTLGALKTLRARFLQVAPTGEISEGTLYLSRPGKLRVEYDPPTGVLVVANGSYFTFVDTKVDQYSYLDLDSSPAGLLLKPEVRFSGKDARITRVAEPPGVLEITVVQESDPTAGSLTLVFTRAPFALAQWRVTDAQGLVTSVTLQNPETGVSLQDSLFRTPRPR
jgi:outer membrane lipoprotein-sorting protein